MKTILGIPLHINCSKISEREYVDLVRKRLGASKLRGWLHILSGLALLGLTAGVNTWFFFLLGDARRGFPTGMAVGTTLGIMLGIAAVLAASNICLAMIAFRGNRTDELLVRYYDELDGARSDRDRTPPRDGALPHHLTITHKCRAF
ncbi:MAG: hypothetical protein HQ592_05975 [Planctomycetes bacterium]|nr:hypothetical protein [Planctomycetota bacterium]